MAPSSFHRDGGQTWLTFDLGNSALKLALFESTLEGPATLLMDRRIAWGSDIARALLELGDLRESRAGRGVLRALCSSVAGPERVAELESACKNAGLPAPCAPAPGLSLAACHNTESIGADRLYAARGAWELVGGPVLVLDAGTALTVDAVGCDSTGAPAFLGGAIAPGPGLLASALGRGARALYEVSPKPGAPALGRDSAGALRAGLSRGFVGAARELAREVAREAGLEGAPIALTGGSVDYLLSAFADQELHLEPQLVGFGLVAAARAGGLV